MLVVSRKKHESIHIDGSIHVEIISHMKNLVRVKLLTPRSFHVTTGSKKELRGNALAAPNGKPVNGHDELTLAIGTREHVRLGDAIILGVVDANTARALFFVEGPPGTSIIADGKPELGREAPSSGQSFLPFMDPGERVKRDQQADAIDSRVDRDDPAGNGTPLSSLKRPPMAKKPRRRDSGPNLLPFPCLAAPKWPAGPSRSDPPAAANGHSPLASAPGADPAFKVVERTAGNGTEAAGRP